MSSTEEEVKHLQISLRELSDATDAFSNRNLIAKGGFGKVYKGVTVKHGDVAVKMLDPGQGQGDHEFRTEIALLSVYKHENIVSLVGFCEEDGQKILVYKYEANGSLDRYLDSTHLTWIQRLRICLDAARGLQYLHDDVGSEHRILHRDVKSSNILLDDNWKAKISDFGLSRVGPANMQSTFLISSACGTPGYIDPEYLNTGYLTQKSDVYSFGVVLFEVLCGRLTRVQEYRDIRQFLINLVKIHWERKTLDEIIYSDIQEQINTASLLTFSNIAYQCLMSRNERPTMKKVVEQLQKALDNQLTPSDLWMYDDRGFAAQTQGQSGSLASSSQSVPEPWMYDVFISFRGEDTHKVFVEDLYHALESKGIISYMDDETLPRGESTLPSILKAIQGSRMYIIVFSKNYASSSWCLDELKFIMENTEKRGQLVIPVFYDVEPKVVRNQTGYYGEAFDMHKLNNNSKIGSWRIALKNAANRAGYEINNTSDGYKSEFIKEICDNILDILLSLMPRSKTSVETSASTDLIGIETRTQELISLLEEVGSGGVRMVGICGIWGSGKSTLASCTYDEISSKFRRCCFLENVRARSGVHGLKTLQEEIVSNLLRIKVTITDNNFWRMMMNRLRPCRVLIVLDDVDRIEHLNMLAGSQDWFADGSRIIFTTRNEDLVKAHNCVTHNVRMLDDTEAIELFSRHAFRTSKPIQGFEKVSQNMVSKFGGHPSALIRMGSLLHGKGRIVWMRIMDRLEGMQVDEILKKFKISDDEIARNNFLDEFQI